MLMEAERKEIVKISRFLFDKGFVQLSGGNVSMRDPNTQMVAIKPSGIAYLSLIHISIGRGALTETLAGNGALGSMVEAAGNGIFSGFVKWGGIAAAAAVVLFILYGVVKRRTED